MTGLAVNYHYIVFIFDCRASDQYTGQNMNKASHTSAAKINDMVSNLKVRKQKYKFNFNGPKLIRNYQSQAKYLMSLAP